MNIFKIDQNVFRGAAPETDEDIAQLKAMGIQFVVNLESGWFEFIHHRTDWESTQVMEKLGIPIRVHWSPIFCPTRIQLFTLAALIKKLSEQGSVYFHCLKGVDRTGLLAAFYRVMYQGWTVDRAIEEMYEMGFHRFPYESLGWVRAFRKYFEVKP